MGTSSRCPPFDGAVTQYTQLPDVLRLTAGEQAFLDAPPEVRTTRLPLKIPRPVMDRICAPGDPPPREATALRRQFIPTADELTVQPYELADPLGEERYSPVPRLIHRYPDRALLLVTDQCAVHCRHCFRSGFTGGTRGTVTFAEVDAVARYLAEHTEVRELILSGGDALMLGDRALSAVLGAVRSVRPEIVLRAATRMPVLTPQRITPSLVRGLRSHTPLWVVIQVNHAGELVEESRLALCSLVDAGLPVVSQTVLLRGVNDDVATLEDLFTNLVGLRVKPYYLFQADLARGTRHFRVNLHRALGIVNELRSLLSGLAMPVFAADIPGGGGKVRLEPSALAGEDEGGYLLRAADGSLHRYPKEER